MKSDHLASPPSAVKKSTAATLENQKISSVHLQHVSVHRHNQEFNDISLQLKPGMVYGLVGNLERRKLLIHLIMGTIRPSEGSVYVNTTTDIATLKNWSSYVNLIEKENQLFSEEAVHQLYTKNEVAIEAITRASLFDATAGKLLNSSPVLILDEAMSSLDIELEERAMGQICSKNKDNIVIFNTTRPSSLKYCDHILLLKNNRIAEISKQVYFTNFSVIFGSFFEDHYIESML